MKLAVMNTDINLFGLNDKPWAASDQNQPSRMIKDLLGDLFASFHSLWARILLQTGSLIKALTGIVMPQYIFSFADYLAISDEWGILFTFKKLGEESHLIIHLSEMKS